MLNSSVEWFLQEESQAKVPIFSIKFGHFDRSRTTNTPAPIQSTLANRNPSGVPQTDIAWHKLVIGKANGILWWNRFARRAPSPIFSGVWPMYRRDLLSNSCPQTPSPQDVNSHI